MKTFNVFFIFSCFAIGMQAQTITKSSIDSGGANTASGDIQILYSIGETHVNEVTVATVSISEGFISENTASGTLSTDDFALATFNFYPNPAKDKVFIKTTLQNIEKVDIFNTNGQKIMEAKNNFEIIDISHLAATIYVMKIYTANSSKAVKVIKQ